MDEELRQLERELAHPPGDPTRAVQFVLAAARMGEVWRGVELLASGLAEETAEASLHALSRQGDLAPVVLLSWRAGTIRGLMAARALQTTLGAPFDADLPSPLALFALVEREQCDRQLESTTPAGCSPVPALAGVERLVWLMAIAGEVVRARSLHEPDHERALYEELAACVERGPPTAWSDWSALSLALIERVEHEKRPGFLPWLDALRFLRPSIWWHEDARWSCEELARALHVELPPGPP